MLLPRSALQFLATAVILGHVTQAQVTCPWDDPALEKWSEESTWSSGVPTANSNVVIPAGKKVLLDGPIPRLLTLTIDGVLVWGDVDGIRLETSYVLVNGEFHIGSEDCNFEKQADIFLYGKINSDEVLDTFGRKFIGANDGGVLEMHGKAKKSWTKITETVGPNPESCGNIFDSSTNKFGEEYQEGLHVVVWNPDGTVYDHHVSATENGDQDEVDMFVYRIGNLTATDKIVGIAVREDIGSPSTSWEPLYQAIEGLGGNDIRNIDSFEPYTLIAVTGHPETAQEMRVTRGSNTEVLTASASYTLQSRGLVFKAESATVPSGSGHFVRFTVTTKDLTHPVVTVLDDVSSWQSGDKVVVASTDYIWEQSEVRTIVECEECTSHQFRVDCPFENTHYGHITYGVDERAEVGLLSRNIRVEGELQEECYHFNDHEQWLCERFGRDTFGGHIIVLRGGSAHIEGVELNNLGQQNAKGFYPFHWHMCDEVPGQYFKNNAIYNSLSRCVTIHGTDNSTVEDNVCYLHLGHGMMLEDSAERWNRIHHNFVLGTMHGTIIPSDKREADCDGHDFCNLLSSYWITRPENYVTDNVAAGSDGHGIVLSFADVPIGLSYDRQIERGLFQNMSAQYTKVELFTGNVMHSNLDSGLWFDSRISNGQYHNDKWVDVDGMIWTNGFYDPRDPPNENGQRVESVLSGLTFYRNDDFDVWIRCGNIVITNSSFADTTISVLATHTTGETSCDVRHSIFIGETENKGKGFTYVNSEGEWGDLPKEERPTHVFDRSYSDNRPDIMQHGIVMYQGLTFVDNCYFDRYYNNFFNDSFLDEFGYRPVHPSSAIGFKRVNDYPLVSRSGTMNLKWGYCDGSNNGMYLMSGNETMPKWELRDGTGLVNFIDYDGSLTGTEGATMVRNRTFMTGPECLFKPEWDMSVCPYKYTWLQIKGEGGVLDGSKEEQWPVAFIRDDSPEDPVIIQGLVRLAYPVRVNRSYTVKFNTTLGDAPTEIKVKAKHGLEGGDSVRVALCLPKTTTSFYIKSTVPKIDSSSIFPEWVDSLAKLDADDTMMAYFWDPSTGYLYFKMASNETFSHLDQEYSGDAPREVTIRRLDGDSNPATCDYINPPYIPQTAAVPAITLPSCAGPDTPQGLGAPVVEAVDNSESQDEECPVPDPVYISRPSEPRGCFRQKWELQDFASDMIELKTTMNPQLCIDRCRQKGLPFAGLQDGDTCECANSIGRNGILPITDCDEPCTGDSSLTCGGDHYTKTFFYTSGAELSAAPARCGPLGRGAVFQGQCVYLNYITEAFWSADERCKTMGGRLAKIDTAEKMRFIEQYVLDVDIDVWFGIYADGDIWRFLDGTEMTFTNWRTYEMTPSSNRHLFLQAYRRYKWNKSPDYRTKMSICDLTLDTLPNTGGDCGYLHKGSKFGDSDRCFYRVPHQITYQDATLHCKRMFGRLASTFDSAEKADAEGFLNSVDDDLRYWVLGDSPTEGRQAAYNEDIPRSVIDLAEDGYWNGLCLLDSTDTDGCASGWVKGGDKCYWDTGLSADTYFGAAGVCNGERTSVLSINSQAESDFVGTLLSGKTWTDVRYDGILDDMIFSNGETPAFSQWSTLSPLQELSNGLCVVSDVGTGTWSGVPCSGSTEYNIVCEAPLSFFDDTTQY